MIYINLRGNLGNQMFEYALARKLQEQYNQKICINYYAINRRKKFKCSLSEFKLNNNVIFESNKKLPFYTNSQYGILRALRKIFPKLTYNIFKRFGIFIWLGTKFVKLPNKEHKDFYIDGYFQSDKYFNEVKEILLKEFIPKSKLEVEKTKLYDDIVENDVTCISVRRGDYVSNKKINKIFYVCNEKYFNDAIDYAKNNNLAKIFMICSDDVKWAESTFKFNKSFEQSSKLSSVENLYIMSNCKNFIISNSTYSWWAQYLCKNKSKIVVAPSIWFKNGMHTDIYQDYWKLIQIEE